MQAFKIYTEGVADIKFIKDFVAEHFDTDIPDDLFHLLKSWNGYKTDGHPIASIQENFDAGKQTILILDADNSFAQRNKDVIKDFENYKMPIHLFLFPNNAHEGCLENMLCEIAVERKLFNCFEAYQACIAGYQMPTIKDKIYAYLDALLIVKDKSQAQFASRNYRNPAHWNLQHEYLSPLHQFLEPFFK